MPIREFCRDPKKREDCIEEIFLAGQNVPEELDGRKRIVSSPTFKFSGPFSGGTTGAHKLHKAPPGSRIAEAGVDKDTARAHKERMAKQDTDRKKFIEKELSTLDL
jgi:hypothetical protein